MSISLKRYKTLLAGTGGVFSFLIKYGIIHLQYILPKASSLPSVLTILGLAFFIS